MRGFPRVLVVDATPFNRQTNNGIMKSNLFDGWPKSALAQIGYSNVQPGFDVCEHYWPLRKTSILLASLGFARDASIEVPHDLAGSIYDPEAAPSFESRPRIEILFAGLSKSIKQPIGEVILRLPSVMSGSLRRWIDRFAPQVVFTLGGTAPILRLAAKVAQLYEIPLVPYYTDDWVSCIHEGDLCGYFLRRGYVYWFHRCLGLSTVRLTASDAMTREYQARFGGRFETFMNLTDRFDPPPEKARPCLRLSFIGALSPNRWQPLRSIGIALSKLRERGTDGELVIYSFPDDIRRFGPYLAECDAIQVVGTAAPHEVKRIQSEANVLVHVESFDGTSRRITRLSLSTKIPQYLMAGRCLLAYGPPEAASIRYIADTGTGLAVSVNDVDVLSTELERLISSPVLRLTYAARARQTALQRHDASTERKRFREIMAEASFPQVGRDCLTER